MWLSRASLVVVAACSFPKSQPRDIDAANDGTEMIEPDGSTSAFHLRFAAAIDGESYLHIKGTTLWLENRIFAAPGRYDADAMAPWDIRPISLDAVAWLPTWPDVPTPENRDCMCISSKTQVPIGVPTVPSTTTVTEVNVRRPQGVIQQPDATNQWELVVLLSDYAVGGVHLDFVIEVDVRPN